MNKEVYYETLNWGACEGNNHQNQIMIKTLTKEQFRAFQLLDPSSCSFSKTFNFGVRGRVYKGIPYIRNFNFEASERGFRKVDLYFLTRFQEASQDSNF